MQGDFFALTILRRLYMSSLPINLPRDEIMGVQSTFFQSTFHLPPRQIKAFVRHLLPIYYVSR
jgi:hypothetical protein